MYVIDEKKEKYIERECTSRENISSFSLSIPVYSQWLIYSNLVILGYKTMPVIMMIIIKKDCY